jgi:hypothetical protein
MTVSGRRMFVSDLAVVVCGGRMLLRVGMLSRIMQMRRLMVMMRGGVVMGCCLVMMLTRRMLR